jgi:hypothetical protein
LWGQPLQQEQSKQQGLQSESIQSFFFVNFSSVIDFSFPCVQWFHSTLSSWKREEDLSENIQAPSSSSLTSTGDKGAKDNDYLSAQSKDEMFFWVLLTRSVHWGVRRGWPRTHTNRVLSSFLVSVHETGVMSEIILDWAIFTRHSFVSESP